MKKNILSFIAVATCFIAMGCGSSSGGAAGNAYSTFGETLDEVIPAGLKAGGANASLTAPSFRELSGECASSYTGCPYITASGGGDSSAGEILMRLWGLDYSDECSEALLENETCFYCTDCSTGITNYFIKPTMLVDPTTCATTSTTAGHYVNMDVDPCFFDNMIGQISNIAECETVEGGAVDISSAVPWYASWGIPQTVNFSSYYSKSGGGGIWWTVNNGGTVVSQQYFLSLDSSWLYVGIKDTDSDEFIFFGTGSPAYYAGRGEGSGVNISAYTGPVTGIPTQFEAMQVRVQDEKYIERIKSNGTYLWFQKWAEASFPATPSAVDTYKNSPSENRCVLIGSSVVTSKYVPLANCVTSFGKASVTDMNQDSNYTLKVIDQQTANSVSFSTALTPTTTTSCLTAE